MTKQLLLSGLALATLALNACSSEPSDWRPDKKVSTDMVAPGHRSSDNFDLGTSEEANQAKGGAIANPISSHATLDARRKPKAEEAMSADAEEIQRTGKAPDGRTVISKPGQEDTTAGGHEIQR